jgi:hypothetical protein
MTNEQYYISTLSDKEFFDRVLHFRTVESQVYVFNLGDRVKQQLFKQYLVTLDGYDELKAALYV